MRNDTDETARPSIFSAQMRAESIELQAEADHAAHGYHMDATDRLLCGGMVSCGSVLPYAFPLSRNRSDVSELSRCTEIAQKHANP